MVTRWRACACCRRCPEWMARVCRGASTPGQAGTRPRRRRNKSWERPGRRRCGCARSAACAIDGRFTCVVAHNASVLFRVWHVGVGQLNRITSAFVLRRTSAILDKYLPPKRRCGDRLPVYHHEPLILALAHVRVPQTRLSCSCICRHCNATCTPASSAPRLLGTPPAREPFAARRSPVVVPTGGVPVRFSRSLLTGRTSTGASESALLLIGA